MMMMDDDDDGGGGGGGMFGGKRKMTNSAEDEVKFRPLGSGQEVGRSCHIIEFKGKTIMLDCGIHPAYSGQSCLPFLNSVDLDQVDILLVSHFHLDHAAAIPYLTEKTNFRGKIYMTHPTKSIYKLILQDYVKVSSISVDDMLYTEQDVLNSMAKIDTVNFHQVVVHKGIKFWCYNAGHVLGAAMFMIEIAGVKILYTGDYSRSDDRHLMAAEMPDKTKHRPDILIVESTYGVQRHQPRKSRERAFTDFCANHLRRGGNVLIPVFALGRAQELLLILDEYWEAHAELQQYPIYYAGALANKCMKVYQTYINMMNSHIRQRALNGNPFRFRHVYNFTKGVDELRLEDQSTPCVVFASPGMLQNGLSRELFEEWCESPKNGVIIPGYCVEGTLAHRLITSPPTIKSMVNGQDLAVKCAVSYVSFSAHADGGETCDFIDELRPPVVILVHGDANQMARLQQKLVQTYPNGEVKVVTPQNIDIVSHTVHTRKIAKTVGTLANTAPAAGSHISGLVVERNFKYRLMNVDDLPQFTPIKSSVVNQKLTVPFQQTLECLRTFLGQLYELRVEDNGVDGDDEPAATGGDEDGSGAAAAAAASSSGSSGDGMTTLGVLMVQDIVRVIVRRSKKKPKKEPEKKKDPRLLDPRLRARAMAEAKAAEAKAAAEAPPPPPADSADHLILEWKSNPVGDMIADSIVSMVMHIQVTPTLGTARMMGASSCQHEHHHHHHHDEEAKDGDVACSHLRTSNLEVALKAHFQDVSARESDGCVVVHAVNPEDGKQATVAIDPMTMVVAEVTPATEEDGLSVFMRDRIITIAQRASNAIYPIRST